MAEIAARGIEPAERETYSTGERKITPRDADGNEVGFGGGEEPPPGGNELIFVGRFRLVSPAPEGFPSTCPARETETTPLFGSR